MKRNEKGQFVKNKKGTTLMASVITSTDPIATPYEEKDKKKNRNIKWIPFGSDNLFPQQVAKLGRQSAAHRSILNFKTLYVSGNKIIVDESEKGLQEYIDNVNANEESQKEVTDKISLDFNHGGNAYLELVTDGKRSFMNQYHKDWTTARYKKTEYTNEGKVIGVPSVLFHPDWENVTRTKGDIVEIPLYPNFAKVNGQLRSIVHFKSYEPTFDYYGIPDWVAALDAAGIAYKTNKWNISRLDNSFASSGVLIVDGDLSEQDAAALKADFQKEFTGEGKQGKVMMIVKALGGGGSDFTPITSTADGDWVQLHNQSRDELIMAHGWFRSLSAVGEAGQLGNTQQMRNEYQAAHNTTIPFTRSKFMPMIAKVIKKELGFDTSSMEIKNIPSLNMMDLLNANKFTKIWEARKEAGLDFEEDNPEQNKYIEEAKNGAANDSK